MSFYILPPTAEMNTEIRKAADTLYELSVNEKVRAEYEMRQKAWRDRMSSIEDARQEGRQAGRQEGIAKERQYVFGLINQGLSADEIKQRLDSENK